MLEGLARLNKMISVQYIRKIRALRTVAWFMYGKDLIGSDYSKWFWTKKAMKCPTCD